MTMSNMLETKEAPSTVGARGIGHYALRRELGRGGMSVVYEAVDTRTGQPVALKLLRPPLTLDAAETDALVARFEREARTVARLSHPNVIGIHEIGVVEGQHFLAMEFLRGQTLRQRLTRSRLPARETCSVLTQIAGALDAVHAAGIVHRDVKASNIMLLPDGTAKLLDFGIARSSEEAEITSDGAILGTPSYMAPEHVRGEPAAPATDLWSLGVLSYEMLTGHLPFAGQVVANVLYQVLNSSPAPMPALPKAVQKVLRRALDKDPSRRYQSAAALAEAIGAALPKSVLPKPVLPEPTASKAAIRQRPLPRWALGAALLLLFFGAFGIASQHRPSAPARPKTVIAAAPPPALQVTPSPAPVVTLMPPISLPRQAPESPPVQPVTVQSAARETQGRQSTPEPPQLRGPVRVPETLRSVAPEPPLIRTAASPVVPAKQSAMRSAKPPETIGAHETIQAQASVQAQAAVQSVTLPASGDTDDPEADARLRKSNWSQQDSLPVAP